ncbi:MAG: autotransporter outer membrane beta-barrel domain-containing protein [Yersinia sp. (in: enterobacteria)]
MENTNKQIESILKTSIPKQAKFILKKKPIAKFITAALLVLGCSSASADFVYSQVDNDKQSTKPGQQIKDAVVEENERLAVILESNAQDTRVNAGGYFELDSGSSANETHVFGGIFKLLDDGGTKADNSKISNGRMELLGDSIASNTFVGLTDEDEHTVREEGGSEKSAVMEMYKDAKANNTKVGINGTLILHGDSTVENTTVNKGGTLVINSESVPGPELKNTSVMGTLLLESDVKLEGKTEFLPGAHLRTDGNYIINNGELTFTNIGGGIFAVIEGSGSLTIDSPGKTFSLEGTGESKYDEYDYSDLTHIKAGTLELSGTTFSTSPIIGDKGTELILSDSVLRTGVQGSHMIVKGKSMWYMTNSSGIAQLVLSEQGQINLSGHSLGSHHIGNTLRINGDYSSDGGSLTFYSKLAGDASETDSMLVEGDTSGLTYVNVINSDGEGAQTDLGIQLIKVEGQSDGDFKQVGRITAGAYEYKLSRGKADLSKNWYLTSNIESYDKKSTPEEQLGVIPGKGDDKADVVAAPVKVEAENISTVKPTDAQPTDVVATPVKAQVENISTVKNGSPHEVINVTGKGYPPHPINQLLAALIPEKEDGKKEDVVAALAKAEAENISTVKNGSPHEVINVTGKGYPPHPINQLLAALIPEKEDGKKEDVVAAPAKAEAENISTFKPTDVQPTDAVATLVETEVENISTVKPTDAQPTDVVAAPAKGKAENISTVKPTDAVAMTPVKTKADNSKDIPQKTYKPVYRPESGSYIANLSMARNLFTSGLENRSGNYQYQDAITGEWRTTSMWIHTQGGRKQFGNTVDQLNIKGKYHSIQLGGDLAQWSIGAQGSWRIGMLAGFGKATNYSQSKITGYYSNGSVNGYNLGIYATWLTDQQDKTGFYIDTLAQYGWFNNTVNGQEQAEEKYKSSGFTSSVESGYTFNIGSTDQLSYFIQPNAQITWVGINAQTHTTANKDVINYNNRGQLVTRIGAKTYLQTTNNMNQQFMPFIAVNWLHQNKNTGTQLSGQRVENNSKNSAEFKIGVESKIDQKLHVWANINHQMGSYDNNDTNALVGLKYHF